MAGGSGRPPLAASAIAFGLTGFVLGVVVTLLAMGALGHGGTVTPAPPIATLPPAPPMADSAMAARIAHIANVDLGPAYPGPKKTRVMSVTVSPVVPGTWIQQPLPVNLQKFRNVTIAFHLNDHPLGKTWRLRAAQADVFALLKSLYTSHVPVYNVELNGYFPLERRGKLVDQQVLVAYMDHSTAEHVPWKRWGRVNEQQLWKALSYKYVNPRFG